MLSLTKPLVGRLSEWSQQLPHDRGTEGTAPLVNMSSFLHLGYHAVMILLFRAMMRPFHNAQHTSFAERDRPEYDAAREQVRAGAKSCCVAFLGYIRELDSKEFHSFWPFCMLPRAP